KNKALLKELSQLGQNSNDLHFKTRRSQPFSVQCAACLWRQTLSLYRNPSYSAVRLLFIILIALILGDLYSGVGSKRSKEEDILDAVGSMFTAITFLGVQNVTTVQPLASFEMSFFYREKAAGLYSPFAYAFGQIVGELPYILLQTLIYSVIVYAMMGFEWKTEKFFWFFFFMLFALLYSTILGMLTVIVTPNEQVAGLTSSVVLTIWVLFSGFIIPKTRISVYWRWCYYATPYGWSLNGLAASQFGDVRTELDNQQTVEEFMRSYFGYSHGSVGYVAAINAAIALLFGACYGFAINIFNFQKR
ncbi:pleiotropic drug resistance protein 1, partial [Genlisea aurea]